MIRELHFDSKFRGAMLTVFGKTLMCRDIDVASQYSKSANMDCVTMEGMFHRDLFLTWTMLISDRSPVMRTADSVRTTDFTPSLPKVLLINYADFAFGYFSFREVARSNACKFVLYLSGDVLAELCWVK